MIIRIDKMSEDPLYLQIRSQIIGAIARGELRAGDSLPSVRSLAADLGINLHTVNKAYAVLRDEGYLIMRGRSGAFVAEPLQDSSKAKAALVQEQITQNFTILSKSIKPQGVVQMDSWKKQKNRLQRCMKIRGWSVLNVR